MREREREGGEGGGRYLGLFVVTLYFTFHFYSNKCGNRVCHRFLFLHLDVGRGLGGGGAQRGVGEYLFLHL